MLAGKGEKGQEGTRRKKRERGEIGKEMGVLPFRLSPSYVTWGPPPVSARRGLPRLVLVRSLMTALNPRLALAFIIFADETRSGAGAGRGCVRARSPRTDPRGAPGPCLGLSRGTHLPASCNFFPFSPRVLRSIFVIPRLVGPGGGSLGSLTCGALLATLARIGPCMCGGSPRYDAAGRVWEKNGMAIRE